MSQRMVYQTEETRQKILAAAETMFVDRGFFDTQMKDVADAVGISRNSLYRYFHDKSDLGYAVLGAVYARSEPRLVRILDAARAQPGLNGRERLQLFLEQSFQHKAVYKDLKFMAEFDCYFSGERIPADFGSRAAGPTPRASFSRIGELLNEGVQDGSIRSDISARELLPMVVYALKVLQQYVLLRGPALLELSHKETRRLLPNLITVLVDGLKPVEPA